MGDITKSAVSQWESDSTMPTTAALLLIRTKVEFSIDWLLFDSGDPPDGDQRTRHLIEMYQQLDERGKAAVFRTAEAESSYTVSDADLTKRSA